MTMSRGRLDRAAEERPWLTGLATGVPAGIVLAVVLAAFDGGEAFGQPMRLIAAGIGQGLIIAVLVAAGGTWRRRWSRGQQRASETRRDDDLDA
jgi:high-affinity Fe2+/Pb2+ permease